VIATRVDHRASADRTQDVKVPVCFAGEAACAATPIVASAGPGADAFAGFPIAPAPGSARRPGVSAVPLAATGTGAPQLVPGALALVAGGGALVALASRRRRDPRPTPATLPRRTP
jgi:hypothetical protein